MGMNACVAGLSELISDTTTAGLEALILTYVLNGVFLEGIQKRKPRVLCYPDAEVIGLIFDGVDAEQLNLKRSIYICNIAL